MPSDRPSTTFAAASFEAGFASMQKGFTGTLDQLADYLVKF